MDCFHSTRLIGALLENKFTGALRRTYYTTHRKMDRQQKDWLYSFDLNRMNTMDCFHSTRLIGALLENKFTGALRRTYYTTHRKMDRQQKDWLYSFDLNRMNKMDWLPLD